MSDVPKQAKVVVIGKLIPARAPIIVERPTPIAEIAMPESLLLPFIFDFEHPEPMIAGEEESLFELLQAGTPSSSAYVAEPD